MPLLRFLPEATKINFVGARYVAFAIDGLLLLASIVSIAVHGFNLGIDFTGGVLMEVKSAQVIDIGKLRSEVNSLGFKESQIQYFGGGECDKPADSCVLIRVQPDSDTADQATAQKIKARLGPTYVYRRAEVVGPKVSASCFMPACSRRCSPCSPSAAGWPCASSGNTASAPPWRPATTCW